MRKKIVSHALAWLVVVLLSLTSPTLTKADTLIDILLSNGDSGIVALAQDYEGLNEKKDRKDLKTAIGVDPVRTPWCAAFINHLLEKQGKQGTDNLTALSFLRWGKKTVQPKPGDIAVLYGHVTIFLAFSEDGTYIKNKVILNEKITLRLRTTRQQLLCVANRSYVKQFYIYGCKP